jgi:hypothetical protein
MKLIHIRGQIASLPPIRKTNEIDLIAPGNVKIAIAHRFLHNANLNDFEHA